MRQPVRKIQQRAPVLSPPSLFYLPPQSPRDPMHPIANPQNRYAKCQHRVIACRRIRVIRGTRPTRQNQSRGLILPNIRNRGRARQNRRKHLLLPHPPRNELRILPSKIQHHHAAALRIRLSLLFLQLSPACHPLPSIAPLAASFIAHKQHTVIPSETGGFFLPRSVPLNASARAVEESPLDLRSPCASSSLLSLPHYFVTSLLHDEIHQLIRHHNLLHNFLPTQ